MGCFGSRAAGASLNCAEAPKAVRKTTANRQTKRLFPADLLKSIDASHALILTPHSNSCLKGRERGGVFCKALAVFSACPFSWFRAWVLRREKPAAAMPQV